MGINEPDNPKGEKTDWANRSLTELVDYIVERHHRYMDRVLPEFLQLMEETKASSTGHFKSIIKSLGHFSSFLTEGYMPHALREENFLFPYIRKLEAYANNEKEKPEDSAGGGLVFKSMAAIDNEHNQVMDTLTRMKAKEIVDLMTSDAPEPLAGLQKLVLEIAEDLNAHTLLEDTSLFPRAVELEKKLGLHK